ncbi:F-box protein At5g49610-like [Mercurialis annua]|uniref:F-box protein At5g49610-like n=1 Tax=Mercurialis annua TaxID=3986 RepID=UPI00215E2E17|nr:F-box protein At5g49610-like [Mercurialis annua]
MNSANRSHCFSSDIIFEILSRSSLSTLGKCRQLSKDCNSLTYEASFTNLYCKRSNVLSGFFLQNLKRNKHSSQFVSVDNSDADNSLSLDFLSKSVQIVCSTTQGFLLCVDQNCRGPRYYICKPTTKEWKVLPNPKTRYFTERIGMMVLNSHPLRYKIVRFSKQKFQKSCRKWDEFNCLRCEVFNFSTSEWKQQQDVKLSYGEFLSSSPTVSARGSLHWLTNKNNVFAFHEDTETYSLFSLPSSVSLSEDDYGSGFQLVEYEGKLGLICTEHNFMELWILENYERKIWSLRQKISLESLEGEVGCGNFLAVYNSDVALMRGFYRAIFYKFKNGLATKKVIINHESMRSDGVFPFRSDFELSNLKNEYVETSSSGQKSRKSNKSSLQTHIVNESANLPESTNMPELTNMPTSRQNLSFSVSPDCFFLVLLFLFTFFCFIFDF